MSPAPEASVVQRARAEWRSSACDLCALIAIPCALVILGWFPDFAWVAHALLVITVLMRTWLAADLPEPQKADYVVLTIGAVELARFLFGQGGFGTQRFASAFAGILLYASLRMVRHRRITVRWTLFSLGVLGALLAAYSLLWSSEWIARVFAAGFSDVTALKGTAASVLHGLVNEWATVLILLLVLQVAAIRPMTERLLARNALVLGVMLPVAAALCLTFSRGTYAAALLFVVAVAVLVMCDHRFAPSARMRLISALLLLMAVSAVTTDRFSGGAVGRTAAVGATEQQRRSTAGRLQVWSSALELAAPHWLLGSGPGTFAMRYVPKAGLGEGRSYVGRPLNTALELLVEEGALGAALQGLLALVVVVSAWGEFCRAPGARSYRIGVLAAGCGAFWVREMTFSSLLENRLVMALYWVLLGLLALISAPPCATNRKPRTRAKIALTTLAAAAVLIFGAEERSNAADRAAVVAARALQDDDLDSAQSSADKAVSIRATPANRGLRALISARAAMPAWDPRHPVRIVTDPAARRRLQAALRDLDLALVGNPDDDLFWHNRAWIQLQLGGSPNDVMPDLRRAVAIDGGSACYRVGLGLLLEQQGRTDEATAHYAAALAAAPDSCDSEFARDLKSRAASLWATALSRAIAMLQVRDPRDQDVSTRARLARLYMEQGQTARARTMLETVTQAMPQLPRAWANLGRIYLDSADREHAKLYFKKAAFLDGSDPIVSAQLAWIAKSDGDQETADSLHNRALMIAEQHTSPHARRFSVYRTAAIVRDDILPPGLLAYCGPSISRPDAQPEPHGNSLTAAEVLP